MNILIDTNVALDIAAKREPFYENSFSAVRQALKSGLRCYFSASSAKDVYYVIKNQSKNSSTAKNAVIAVAEIAKLDKEEIADYESSLKKFRDLNAAIKTAKMEGEKKKAIASAKEMKADKMPFEKITKYTGLTAQEIEAL